MNTRFVQEFNKFKYEGVNKKEIRKGYWDLLICQNMRFYLLLAWELATVTIFYAPVSDLFDAVLEGPNKKWDKFSAAEKRRILAALHDLNKRGDISIAIKNKLDGDFEDGIIN